MKLARSLFIHDLYAASKLAYAANSINLSCCRLQYFNFSGIHQASTDKIIQFADAVLAKVEMKRKLSMVKAWEEDPRSKVDNR